MQRSSKILEIASVFPLQKGVDWKTFCYDDTHTYPSALTINYVYSAAFIGLCVYGVNFIDTGFQQPKKTIWRFEGSFQMIN